MYIFECILCTVVPLFTYSIGKIMVVLVVKSTQIEIWISIDLHVKWFNWPMTFPKNAKLRQALRLTCNGV